jgi:hypothetical protein
VFGVVAMQGTAGTNASDASKPPTLSQQLKDALSFLIHIVTESPSWKDLQVIFGCVPFCDRRFTAS